MKRPAAAPVPSTETMLVRRGGAGWWIGHIHWSPCAKAPGGHH